MPLTENDVAFSENRFELEIENAFEKLFIKKVEMGNEFDPVDIYSIGNLDIVKKEILRIVNEPRPKATIDELQFQISVLAESIEQLKKKCEDIWHCVNSQFNFHYD